LSKPPPPANDLFQEETDDRLVADRRNFFKVELWTRDGQHVERLLFAGNSLDKACALFTSYGKRRPRAHLTIRQRSRVLEERPQGPDRKRGVKRTIVRHPQHGASDRRIHQGVTCFLKREL
jgi:hypothetical protein